MNLYFTVVSLLSALRNGYVTEKHLFYECIAFALR